MERGRRIRTFPCREDMRDDRHSGASTARLWLFWYVRRLNFVLEKYVRTQKEREKNSGVRRREELERLMTSQQGIADCSNTPWSGTGQSVLVFAVRPALSQPGLLL